MKIGIFYHQDRTPQNAVKDVADALTGRGAEVTLFTKGTDIGNIERLVVLGGDGTMLRAARRACLLGIPLVGMNYGTIGFLTEFEKDQTEELVELVLDKQCAKLHRSMLEINFGGNVFFSLNELTMMRTISADSKKNVARISVKIDDSPAGDFTADGLIVATPTGSTAYSLSAGGCILTPDCESFLLTPVCAFSMRSRPIACSDKSDLKFVFHTDSILLLHADGKFLGEAGENDFVVVRKAKQYATFLTQGRNNFFHRLTEKIN